MTQATKLIIARHGNTFRNGDMPTRVGARTDLKLTSEGEEQALRLGHFLKAKGYKPDVVYTSRLRRTIDTARLACLALECGCPADPLAFLDEIDYGPDENQPETSVIERLGAAALKNWDEQAVMPEDWSPRPPEILLGWKNFLKDCAGSKSGQTILLVTSNGIARFALSLAAKDRDFPLKLSTGSYGILEYDGAIWHVREWNVKP